MNICRVVNRRYQDVLAVYIGYIKIKVTFSAGITTYNSKNFKTLHRLIVTFHHIMTHHPFP